MALPLYPAGEAHLRGRYVTPILDPRAEAAALLPRSCAAAEQAAEVSMTMAAAAAAAQQVPKEWQMWLKLVGQSTALGPVRLGTAGISHVGPVSGP